MLKPQTRQVLTAGLGQSTGDRVPHRDHRALVNVIEVTQGHTQIGTDAKPAA